MTRFTRALMWLLCWNPCGPTRVVEEEMALNVSCERCGHPKALHFAPMPAIAHKACGPRCLHNFDWCSQCGGHEQRHAYCATTDDAQ
ncbi:hypothetical protein LCGC14_1768920 [marine sediment metagenome]|uniref:Uncharacterized protein n=1 Tax=marine sediment metagenome TaxID=412755 RepID=A0A0F9JDS8_9ZZZZ